MLFYNNKINMEGALLSGIIMFDLFLWISDFSKLFPYKHNIFVCCRFIYPWAQKVEKIGPRQAPNLFNGILNEP